MSEYVSVIGESFSNFEEAVKAILRIRPPADVDKNDLNYFEVVSEQQLNVKVPNESWTYKSIKRLNNESRYNFEFSNIYDWNAGQEKVFSGVINTVVLDFLSGRNSLLFTYGITNSGKTHTLIGKPDDPGILPRTIDYLFTCISKYVVADQPLYKTSSGRCVFENSPHSIEEDNNFKRELFREYSKIIERSVAFETEGKEGSTSGDRNYESNQSFDCEELNQEAVDQMNVGLEALDMPGGMSTTFYVYLSIAEIYNEFIYDLLDPINTNNPKRCGPRTCLKIQGDNKNGFYVKGLKSVLISSALEGLKLLQIGLCNRRMAATKLNIQSSRSHVLYSIRLIRCNELPNSQIATKTNEICFVDLAGAERQSATLSEGTRLREASSINKSLLFLGKCIEEMKQFRLNLNKNIVVSYRESKLTRLLQPFFVGRASMILLVNISPCLAVFDETINVLRFSALTKEALSRPIGVELEQAARTDAMINEPEGVDLSVCTKGELIQILHNMRKKVIDASSLSQKQEACIRNEMASYTMKLVHEMEEDKQREIAVERKLVTETYLVKIDLLNEEIMHLNRNVKASGNNEVVNELVSKNQELLLVKSELERKSEQMKQIMSDVEQYRIDSCDELCSARRTITELERALASNVSRIQQLEKEVEDRDIYHGCEETKLADRVVFLEKMLQDFADKVEEHKTHGCYENDTCAVVRKESLSGLSDLGLCLAEFSFGIIDTVQGIRANLAEQLSWTSQLRSLVADHNGVVSKMSSEIRGLNAQVSRLEENVGLLVVQKDASTKEHEQEVRSKEVEIAKLIERKDSLTRKIDVLEGKLEQSKKENKTKLEYEKNFNEANKENIGLKEKYATMEAAHAERNNKFDLLEVKVQKKKEKIRSLRMELSDLQSCHLNGATASSDRVCGSRKECPGAEVRAYKRLNEEYRQHIAKLEDILSQKNVATKRVISQSCQEDVTKRQKT